MNKFYCKHLSAIWNEENLPVRYPAFDKYVAKVLVSWVCCHCMLEQFSLFVKTLWLWTYIPVNKLLLDGQHIGVVTYACLNSAPPSRNNLSVLGMKLSEPNSTSWSSVKMRMMFGFRSLGRGNGINPCFFIFFCLFMDVKSSVSSRKWNFGGNTSSFLKITNFC